MKKVVFIVHVSGIGGSGFAMLNIIRNLDRSKYSPIVVLKTAGKLSAEIRNLGVQVHYISTINQVLYNEPFKINRRCFALIKQFIQSIIQLYRWLKHNPADVLYVNSMMLYPYLLCAKLAGIRSIIHIRENWPENEHKIQRRYAIKSIMKNADEIIAINNNSASMIPSPRNSITIVYDWVDLSNRYKPIPFNKLFNEDCSRLKVFLFLNGFNPIKGGKQVISAFVNHLNNPDYRLLVIGDCNTANDEDLIKMIDGDNRIVCIPPVYEIKDIVKQAYCMLSFFTIPHANLALAESIILNTPVVAAQTTESIEYSLDGTLAQLYPLGNYEAFVDAIDRTIKNYDEIKKNLTERSNIVKEMFDKEINFRKIECVIDRLIAKSNVKTTIYR